MTTTYTQIDRASFEAALASSVRAIVDRRGLKGVSIKRERQSRGEVIYRIYTGRKLIYIKIYSSLDPVSGTSRPCGEDAIRFVLMDDLCDKPLGEKLAHMKRIATWPVNLAKRLERLFDEAQQLTICTCGSPKVEREGKYGKFLGCLNYREAHTQTLIGANR